MNVSDLGTILGVWAHPDDETWASAGLMNAAVSNKQRVVCVIAADGGKGKTADEERWPAKDLVAIRELEMQRALRCIGVTEIVQLGYPDGELAAQNETDAIEKILAIIKSVQPDTIVTFEPNGITGHSDHKIISRWTRAAAQQSDNKAKLYGACETRERYNTSGCRCHERFNVYFNTREPVTVAEEDAALCHQLSPAEQKVKRQALIEHHSQTAQFFDDERGREYIKALCQCECFIKL